MILSFELCEFARFIFFYVFISSMPDDAGLLYTFFEFTTSVQFFLDLKRRPFSRNRTLSKKRKFSHFDR